MKIIVFVLIIVLIELYYCSKEVNIIIMFGNDFISILIVFNVEKKCYSYMFCMINMVINIVRIKIININLKLFIIINIFDCLFYD